MKRIFIIIAFASVVFSVFSQTSREEVAENPNKAGGVYYAYPVSATHPSASIKGYEPFHISHYGRHGSRYLISDKDYKRTAEQLHKADSLGKLTALGRNVMHRLDSVIIEADGMSGSLTPLGVRQHRGIAERMAKDYPQVFKDETPISARSTIVVRCVLSMDAFCERLKEINPKLNITRESADRYMSYLNYHSPESIEFHNGDWKERYRKFEKEKVNGERMVSTIFSDEEYVRDYINPEDFIWAMYWIAVDMQNMETDISFFDLFTPDELFDIWQCENYGFYVRDGNYPGSNGLVTDNAKPLLRNVIATAEAAIRSPKPSVALRFGHDGNLIPFAALLQLEGCAGSESNPEKFYDVFADFKVAPMAGNVQIVFFRDAKHPEKDVLVKFLHNEKEVHIPVATDSFPFYRWADVKSYWENTILK